MKKNIILLVFTIIVFLTVLLSYLWFCPAWFFEWEDYGLLTKFASKTSFNLLFDIFTQGNVFNLAGDVIPPATMPDQNHHISFFTSFYRPITLLVSHFQYLFFGSEPYAYFVVTIALHAANAALLFYVLASTTLKSYPIALLSTAFFSFHHCLSRWFGRIDTQQHQLCLFLVLVCLMLLIKSINKKNAFYLGLSAMLFLASLLARETFIVLPGIIFLWLHFFYAESRNSPRSKLFGCISITSIFGFMIIIYFLLKSIAYPITMQSLCAIKTHDFTTRLFQIIAIPYNLFWMQWLPWSLNSLFYQRHLGWLLLIIKGFIVFITASLVVTNSKRNEIFFFALSAVVLLWPSIIIGCGSGALRYSYEALPLYACIFAYLLHFSGIKKYWYAFYPSLCIFLFLITFHGINVIASMNNLPVCPSKINRALINFKHTVKDSLFNKPLFIINCPHQSHIAGIAQAMQLYQISIERPKYLCRQITVNSTVSIDKIPENILVKSSPMRLQFISLDKTKISFSINQVLDYPEYLKNIVPNTKTTNNKIFDFYLEFKEGYFDPHFIVVAYFFEQEKFVVLKTT